MNESEKAIIQLIGLFVLLTTSTFLINKEVVSKLIKLGIKLEKENKKEIKRLISSVLGILTVYFSLLRLLLSL